MKKEDIVKKSLLVGVGLAAFAKGKADKLVRDLVKKGNLKPAEGKKLVKSIYGEAEKSGKKVAKVMESELKRMMGVVKKPVKKKTATKKKKVVKKRKKK